MTVHDYVRSAGKMFRNKNTNSWICSYFLIVLVVIFIMIAGNLVNHAITKKEVDTANSRFVMQLQTIYDSYFYDTESNAYKIANNPTGQNIVQRKYQSLEQKKAYAKTIISEAKAVMTSAKVLANIYVVFETEDMVVDSGAMFSHQTFYESFSPITTRAVRRMNFENYGALMLVSENNDIVFSNLASVEGRSFAFLQHGSEQVRNYDDGTDMIGYIASQTFPGTYVQVVDKGTYYRVITTTNGILAVCYVLSLVVAGLICHNKNYRPIETLLNKIELDVEIVRLKENKLSEIFFHNFIKGQLTYNNKDFEQFMLELKGKRNMLVLFNITEFGIYVGEDSAIVKEDVLETLNYAKEFLNIHPGINFNYVTSGMLERREDIPAAYGKLLGVMEREQLFGVKESAETELDERCEGIRKQLP